jgi:pectinesterase
MRYARARRGLAVFAVCTIVSGMAGAADFVVAADGSGRFKTVQEAINAALTGTPADPSVVHIRPGLYKELLYIQREKRFLHLVGEDAEKTVLTYDLHANLPGPDGKPIGTFRTPSMLIDADDLTAENLTFENSAGPVGQALAVRIDGDRVAFRNCRFLGWQDTILANRGRHYFKDCYIAGSVDFIFGGATALFDHCHIHCLRNGYITAASTPDNQPFGFVFRNCRITGASSEIRTYLGRPWRDFASVIFLDTEMSDVVRPEGWNNWRQPDREKTARYAEYNSSGPGANPQARVPWARQLSAAEAEAITAEKVLGGWNPTVEMQAGGASKAITTVTSEPGAVNRLVIHADQGVENGGVIATLPAKSVVMLTLE